MTGRKVDLLYEVEHRQKNYLYIHVRFAEAMKKMDIKCSVLYHAVFELYTLMVLP